VKNVADMYPLSPAQQGMLFHSLYAPSSGVYCQQLAFRVRGPFDKSAFVEAWQHVIDAHPTLRTMFLWQGLDEPVQVVRQQVMLPWAEYDWREMTASQQAERLESMLAVDRVRGFDLGKAPLLRLALIQADAETWHCVWSFHHIILDGWSFPPLLKDVFAAYESLTAGRPVAVTRPRSYRDYIAWLKRQDLSAAERFWRTTLAGVTAPTALTVDRPADPEQEASYAEQRGQLTPETSAALQSLARQHGLTLNTLVQGAWAILLSRYSGDRDVIFGATVSGRPPELAGVESMVGLFINTLPVRAAVDPAAETLAWLKTLQSRQVEQRQYEYSPLVQIQGWSEVPRGTPLFESIVVFENYPIDGLQQRWGRIAIDQVRFTEQTNYPLTIIAAPDTSLQLSLIYDRRRFSAATIERMTGHLTTLLAGIAAQPSRRLADLPLLPAAERAQVLSGWNATAVDYRQDHCLHELIAAQAERTPEAIAVVFEDRHLTYRSLNRRANQLARRLQSLGVGPDVLVGVCLERSLDLVVSLLAVLKAGGVYVPLDPSYPADRLQFMLANAQAAVLLTHEALLPRLEADGAIATTEVICLDRAWPQIYCEDGDNLASAVTPRHLAYMIYTSGSTGKPKGALNTHRAIVNRLLWMQSAYQLDSSDRVLQKTPFSFDVSVWEFFWPLLTGATLVVARPGGHQDPSYLVDLIAEQAITTLHFVPSMLQVFLEAPNLERCGSLRRVICSGEALPPALRDRFFDRLASELHNLYGPTEAAVDVSYWNCQTVHESGKLPIGYPVANTQLYVLDRQLQPVPVGVPGELFIGGVQVGRGYHNRPELTAEKFIPDPFALDAGARLYRTGDRVRYLEDGAIEYLERIDYQIKLRGFRIELGEIEARLQQHPAIREVAVVLREDRPGDRRLVAYVVAENKEQRTENKKTKEQKEDREPSTENREPKELSESLAAELRPFLQAALPEYMVPSAFVTLPALPLSPNGKLDRKALPLPEQQADAATFVAPRTDLEAQIARIWAGVLGVEQLGVHDDFFALGGHSLLATQVVSRLRESFGLDVPLRRIFDAPTVAQLAAYVASAQAAAPATPQLPLLPIPRDGTPLPASFAQQRLWLQDQFMPGTPAYNIPAVIRLSGVLRVAALEQSLQQIAARHETLRTTFQSIDGQPAQLIAPAAAVALTVEDLSVLPAAEREVEALRLAADEARRPFDLQQGPLWRARLLRLDDRDHLFLLTLHHIISDGWSLGVLVEEVAALYAAFSSGANPDAALPALPIQYADFAVWQRQWLAPDSPDGVLQKQADYWKQQLRGAAVLELPTDRPRPPVPSLRGATHAFSLPLHLVEALRNLGRSEDATLFQTLLAAWQTLLHRYTDQDDIVVGTDVANRNHGQIERLIGFFVNQLVLRADFSDSPSFRTLLRRVRDTTLEAYAHQDLPFDKLVEVVNPRRTRDRAPLFQVKLVLQNAPMRSLELPELTLTPVEVSTEAAHLDLTLLLQETADGIHGQVQYSTDLFDAATITRLLRQFETLLTSIVAQPDARVRALALFSETDRRPKMIDQTNRPESKPRKFQSIKPKTLNLQQDTLITTSTFRDDEPLPLVVQPAVAGVDLVEWSSSNQEFIERKLHQHGAVLFRGFNMDSEAYFERFALTLCPELFKENGEHTPVTANGNVQTPVFYPPEKQLLWHNENSFNYQWPLKIWFGCLQPAETGGETPLVDSRKVFNRLDPAIVKRFQEKQIMYMRNYGDGLGLNWQTVFKTDSKAEVEAMCRQRHMEFEWKDGDRLRTRSVRPAVLAHPKTGEMSWFNQAQHWHISCLDAATRESLLALFEEADLPRNCYYGDGSPIEDSVMEEVLGVYRELEVAFPWQKGDIVLVDNVLAAHGRNPFTGKRKILVALGEMLEFDL
jgi:amino acid adenylation domain-containing protein